MIYVTVKVERTIPCHSVVQLSKYFAQNWSVSLAKNAVPKLAIIFKQVPGAVAARYPLGQVKVGWGEVTVRRSHGQGRSKKPAVLSASFNQLFGNSPSVNQ